MSTNPNDVRLLSHDCVNYTQIILVIVLLKTRENFNMRVWGVPDMFIFGFL